MEADRLHRRRGERGHAGGIHLCHHARQDPRFIWVVVDSCTAFALVALLHVLRRDAAWAWIAGGVGLSLAAGAAQAARIDLHPHFNHNDLYHLIQLAAVVGFYRGTRRMTDLQTRV